MSDGTLSLGGSPLANPLLRTQSDDRLAKLAAGGSSAAFAAIYKRHHQSIYRYCRSILGSEHDAGDALQSTMLKAWRALEGETREISLRAWLYRIAHNESIAVIRSRRPETSIDAVPEPADTKTDLEARARLRELIADLDQLTPRQRGALVMRELSGLGFSEIAAALEVSPAAAKQALYEARQALAELERGREMTCDQIAAKISAGDRRMLRARGVRAHLRGCADCRRFEEQIRARRRQLAALAPPHPAALAAGILSSIFGGGGGVGGVGLGAGGTAAAATGTGAASGGGVAGLGGLTAAKLGIAGALVVGAGTAAIEIGADGHVDSRVAPPVRESSPAPSERSAAAVAAPDGYDARTRSGRDSADDRGRRPGDGRRTVASQRRDGGRGGSHGAASANAAEPSGSSAGTSPGSSAAAPAAPSQTPASSSARGPAGTPPGHGGTPPGQGGTPPGLDAPPPGHGGPSPGQSATAPGQVGDVVGQLGDPPGQSATPPGHGGSAPGSVDPKLAPAGPQD